MWWLLAPGGNAGYPSFRHGAGEVDNNGLPITGATHAIRVLPAVWTNTPSNEFPEPSFSIDWGDGTVEAVPDTDCPDDPAPGFNQRWWDDEELSHTYAEPGQYAISYVLFQYGQQFPPVFVSTAEYLEGSPPPPSDGGGTGGGSAGGGGGGGGGEPEVFHFTYSMPPRYDGLDHNGDGLADYPHSVYDVSPDHFAVDLRPSDEFCSLLRAASIKLDGKATKASVSGCKARIQVPEEATYDVEMTIPSGGETWVADEEVVVQDWLVVSIGDSVASGEGNPDVPAGGGRKVAKWQEARCHRSAFSRDSQVAQRLERRDQETSVTFLHLACSGATVKKGLLGKFDGVQPDNGFEQPQLDQLEELTGGREIDAIVTSIGANDIGFGQIVQYCLLYTNCPTHGKFDPDNLLGIPQFLGGGHPDLREFVSRKIGDLASGYRKLSDRLRGIPADSLPDQSRVFLTEYFDPTRGPGGSFCNIGKPNNAAIAAGLLTPPLGGLLATMGLSPDETRWAGKHVVDPLNAEVKEATHQHDWRYVGGIASAFRAGHGQCASPGQRWIQTFDGSYADLGEIRPGDPLADTKLRLAGAVHPNRLGHLETAKMIYDRLEQDLYPKGTARRPGAAAVEPTIGGALKAKSGKVPIDLACPAGGGTCKGDVTLAATTAKAGSSAVIARRGGKSRKIAKAQFKIGSGEQKKVGMKLNRRGRDLTRRNRRLRVAVLVSAHDENGSRAETRTNAKLRVKRR